MQETLLKAVLSLQKGEVILYPTDTIWGIGCDATNNTSVKKVYALKKRSANKSLIVLVDSFEMLEQYVEVVPQKIKNYLLQYSETPITVIYNFPKNLATNSIAKDNTIAVRIVKKGFINKLITAFGKPIVSTSANMSNQKSPKNYLEIDERIINNVDFIVNPSIAIKPKPPSKIIKLDKGEIIVLRE